MTRKECGLMMNFRHKTLAAVSAFALVSATATAPLLTKRPAAFNVVPVTITSIDTAGGQLVANGLVGTTPFQTPLSLTPLGNGTCPILDLSLGPINLSLLGLNVDTSPICLAITANQGGGLLGDLLCAVSNL